MPLLFHIDVTEFDSYGNPLKGYGTCLGSDSGAMTPYLIPLLVIVVLTLIFGNVLCFVCRHDETVNNEVTFIATAIVMIINLIFHFDLYLFDFHT